MPKPIEKLISSTPSTSAASAQTQNPLAESRREDSSFGLFSYDRDYSDSKYDYNSGLESPNMDDMDYGMGYDPVYGFMRREDRSHYANQISSDSAKYITESITQQDAANLKPLSRQLDKYRDPATGKRWLYTENVTEALDTALKSGKGVALYLTNCEKDGLKDPNAGIAFENLKNPLRLANNLKSLGFNTPEANRDLEILTEIALKEKSAGLAAVLLEATKSGGFTRIGTDGKTAKKLLLESRKNFNSDAEYNNFITDIDKAHTAIFKGNGLDEYLEDNYKTAAQKFSIPGSLAAGTAIGAKKGGKIGALVGAAVGLVVGIGAYCLDIGKNDIGDKLQNVLNKARNNDRDVEDRYRFGSRTFGEAAL